MKRKKIINKFCKDYGYSTKKYVGEGGNGFVYKIEKDEVFFAIKVLTTDKFDRFQNEIDKSKKYTDIGTISIIEDGEFEFDGRKYFYYVMPFLTPLDKLEVNSYILILKIIIKLLNILIKLSTIGVFHRDLKPSNIVYDKESDEIYLIDLGIVKDLNDNKDLTKEQERMGTLSFIAPERIKGNNSDVDNEKSDVYSFGMTIWAFLMDVCNGFSGQYDRNNSRFGLKHNGIIFSGISIIDDILEKSTKLDPTERPSFNEINNLLKALDVGKLELSDYYSNIKSQINSLNPDISYWFDSDSICNIVKNTIMKTYQIEMLLMDDGWVGINDIKCSNNYNNFLEIYDNVGPPFLLAPKYLFFFDNKDLPFFILKSQKVRKMKKNKPYDIDDHFEWFQPVTELEKNKFTYQICSFYNDYNTKEINNSISYNIVTEGNFLIRLINDDTDNSILEKWWEDELKDMELENPIIDKLYKDTELGHEFNFKEATSFRSRDYLFSNEEEKYVVAIIEEFEKLKEHNTTVDLFFISQNEKMKKDGELFILIMYLMDQDMNDNPNFPFYFTLKQFRNYINQNPDKISFLVSPHNIVNIQRSISKLYRILYKYSEKQLTYEKFL